MILSGEQKVLARLMSPQGRNRAPRGLVLRGVRFVWDNRPCRSSRHSRGNTRDTVPPAPAIQAGGTHRSRAVSTSGPRLVGCDFCSTRRMVPIPNFGSREREGVVAEINMERFALPA